MFFLVCNQMERGVLAIFGGINQDSAKSIKSFVNYYNIPFITWNNPSYKTSDKYLDDNDNEFEMSEIKSLSESEDYDDINYNIEREAKIKQAKLQEKEGLRNYLINMHPEMSSLLVSIIKYNRHKTIYYLYDHIGALDRFQSLLDYQMRETDFLTNILARRINTLSDGIDLLRRLESEFKLDIKPKSPLPNPTTSEITIMIDFEVKENMVAFLSQIKKLGIKKIHFHYVLVTLVGHLLVFVFKI